jgi:hypothetical protein
VQRGRLASEGAYRPNPILIGAQAMKQWRSHPIRTIATLAIIVLFAFPARTEVYSNAFLRAEAVSVLLSGDKTRASVSLDVKNLTAAPYKVVYLSAILKDDRGYFFEPAARPTGVAIGRLFTCETGAVLAPGASLVIGLSFRISPRLAPDATTLRLSAEFQAQRGTCENFTVGLDNLSVVAN